MRHTIHPADKALPRVRHVDVIPVEQDGTRSFYVRDPLEYASEPLVLGVAGLFILSLLDGRHSFDQVLAALRRRFPGTRVRADQVRELLATLRERRYLDDEVAAAHIDRVRNEFARARVRQPWHAGSAYPLDARELAATLDRFFAAAAAHGDPTYPTSTEFAHREGGSRGQAPPTGNDGKRPPYSGPPAQSRGELAAIMCPQGNRLNIFLG